MKFKFNNRHRLLVGSFFLGVILSLFNCELNEDYSEAKNEDFSEINIETVSLQEAKMFFETNQKINEEFFSKGNDFQLSPDWSTLEYEELFMIDQAKLTTSKVSVNRQGEYSSKLIFIKVDGETKNAIYTIYEDEVSSSGDILKARVFLNEIDGTFIDGFVIDNGLFTKRYVVKRSTVQKGSILSFLFQAVDTEDEPWTTDQIPWDEDGNGVVELDEVVGYGPSGGGVDANTYTIISNWNNIVADDNSSYGSSGGSYSTVLGSVYATNTEIIEDLTIEDFLFELLEANPYALIDIDCNQIKNWQSLAQQQPSPSLQEKLQNLRNNHDGILGDWDIQELEYAKGKIINLDYFSVNITDLPINPSSGLRFTPTGFLDYFRTNINGFVQGTRFSPYCEITTICQQETNLWNSSNPLGSVVKLDISLYNGPGGNTLGNDGVVVVAEFQNNYWRFMTMEAPYDSSHPVTGTREFGIEELIDGSYNIYVRGVDRFTSRFQELVADAFVDNQFQFADNLWESFQTKTNEFIRSNGGSSNINTPILNRANYAKLKDVLKGVRPVSDLGCVD